MSLLEDLLSNQQQITAGIHTLHSNFKKDGSDRKTADYIKRRIETLDGYWQEFKTNHEQLMRFSDKSNDYFVSNHYQRAKEMYTSVREKILSTPTAPIIQPSTPLASKPTDTPEMFTKSQGVTSKKDDLIKKQISNFKAFARTVSNIDMDIITEKWEFQDILKNLESRWSGIDKVHWELDSESDSSNEQYEKTFSEHERTYNDMKKALNSKLWSMSHREKTTPQMEVPNFHGNYHQWVCFKDLFTEAIHSNSFLSNAQKMQFLKSKVKGEAERLIQHLNISSDNYSICWEILQQRYNNKKMIFSSHMNILLNLPVMQQASRITASIHRLHSNFKKDGSDRKTADYIKRRIETIDGYWQEFKTNHEQLIRFSDDSNDYFQISNFKAFARTVSNIDMDIITEKWEFQDIFKNLESRWSSIDKVHWELDNESDSSNEQYEKTFSEHERTYNDMKKSLNSKLWSMSHREKTTPQMEVPNFHGEAERLIQHLNISSDNYSICWEILQQ
ncbi:Uncharacterized protein OBRU01_21088, partial [Operophtera brumata]